MAAEICASRGEEWVERRLVFGIFRQLWHRRQLVRQLAQYERSQLKMPAAGK